MIERVEWIGSAGVRKSRIADRQGRAGEKGMVAGGLGAGADAAGKGGRKTDNVQTRCRMTFLGQRKPGAG